MNNTKHTPGPWHLSLNAAKSLCVESDGHRVGKYPGNIVAVIASKHEANARLIAAAPEMLEALELMAQFIQNNEELFGCFDGFGKRDQENTKDFYSLPQIKAMTRAIAKATGGAE